MAVGTGTPYNVHTGNGSTTVFAYEFTLLDEGDLEVTIDGVATTAYTVSGVGDAEGGSITFSSAPAADAEIIVQRVTALSRTTDYQANGDLLADTLDDDLDRLWLALQELADDLARVPVGEVGGVSDLALPQPGAGEYLRWNLAGTQLETVAEVSTTGSFTQSGTGAVARTVDSKLGEIASPKDFGAVGNGIADDTAAIQAALDAYGAVDMRGATWKITSTITIPSNRFIDLRGSSITAACGSDPIFDFPSAHEGLYILHGGGTISGTAGAFLHAEGSTTTPSSNSHYARQIRLEGVHVTSSTIAKFLDFEGAVRQVFIDKCFAYTANGIDAQGKCVEIMVSKSIIYSSTGAASTYGVRLQSPAGTTYFNEGWHFSDCTIDNFDETFVVDDVFVLTVTGGYISGLTRAFSFGAPTSTTCRHIALSNFVCGQKIRFAPSGGYSYHAQINGLTMTGVSGVAIQLANNTAAVAIRNVKFDTSTSGVAVEMVSNNASCVVDGIDCDSTYTGGVQVKGTAGADCSVGNINYRGTGSSVYFERPVLLKGAPINSTGVATYSRKYNTADLGAAYAVSDPISTLSVDCAEGETGYIDVALNCSGMNAGTQRLDITVPTGMVIPSGTGWSSEYIFPGVAAGAVVARIPYYCTADIAAGSLVITNAVGNSVTVASHSRFGIVKDL